MENFAKTRKEAKEKGEKYFFTGLACKNNHISVRHVSGYCTECAKENCKKNYMKNKEKEKERVKKWQKENPEKYRESQLKYKFSLKCREKNRKNAKIQFHKRRKTEGSFNKKDIDRILINQSGICPYCKLDICGNYHIDHIIPIARGGNNWPENIQLTCPECNLKKGVLSHDEFLALQAAN